MAPHQYWRSGALQLAIRLPYVVVVQPPKGISEGSTGKICQTRGESFSPKENALAKSHALEIFLSPEATVADVKEMARQYFGDSSGHSVLHFRADSFSHPATGSMPENCSGVATTKHPDSLSSCLETGQSCRRN